jgi:hypothetical protein
MSPAVPLEARRFRALGAGTRFAPRSTESEEPMHRALLIAALFLGAACPMLQPDTCNVGKTFGAVRFDDAHPPTAAATTFDLRFEKGTEKGATLPDAYFDGGSAIKNILPDGGLTVTTVNFIESGHLRVNLTQPLGEGVDFAISYPDRRGFIDCAHAGGPDRTRLELSIHQGLDGGATDGGYGLGATEVVDFGAI